MERRVTVRGCWYYGSHGKTSAKYYTHFSLLKTLELGFGLDCLNHACDPSTAAISDLFN
jgi:hypothetical protein